MNYIKLDDQKNKLKPYLYSMFGLLVFILFMVFAMAMVGATITPVVPSSLVVFRDKKLFILFSQVLIQSCFAIFSAVLFSKFVIEDYRERQVVLSFSYPISRSRIFWNKMMFVSFWTAAATFFATIICLGALAVSSAYIPLLNGADLLLSWPIIFKGAAISSLITLMIGVISLAVAFRNKSIISAIITALILCSILSNIMQIENSSLIYGFYGILLAVSVGAVVSVANKVKKMEVS
ncbi:hypothetical protein DOK67_0000012 [Enterococcus sp. DIV0212c]|uniref:hypothetical protein n=1 Tax=Enterococcus sp. DIV0212c TaxID=2230867 RepID=UPI001A9B8E59|nr:hypothetical protein [Enterococcus sp. DIV0212c]MBO1355250.1 hypothetical protein [Enterococcus sp. DIV0212c]